MAKLSQSYETIMVLSPKLSSDETKDLVAKFKELISANGTIDSEEEWGNRKLAYEINDETEGYYYLINFTSPPSLPAELDRRYRISDGVMRSLIVLKEAPSKKAAKAAAKRAEKSAAAPAPATEESGTEA